MHAFLLSKVNDPEYGKIIKDFIKNISLIIIDELHLYKGIFGTNSAYLFRRFNNLHRLICKKNIFAQYITASATLPNATEHSTNITGAPNFIEISAKQDKSPIAKKTFYFVDISKSKIKEGKGGLMKLVHDLSNIDGSKSITFVEARQKTGEMASLNIDNKVFDNVEETGLYPYRAGYEKETIDEITKNLHNGNFKGVISTSALEIGIDIKGLNIVVIADMPQDKNSYQQRIGRVGRFGCDLSYVIIVHDGSFTSRLLFEKYNYDIDKVLPNYEPALYLEDKNVQNIHALCHVGDNDNCEYLDWKGSINKSRAFDGKGYFPDSFVSLCQDILSGQTSRMYDDIKVDDPHHAYPIRFFGKQYQICADMGEHIPNETISREQICSEGYQGAIRNSMCNKYHIKERIVKINLVTGEIFAKREYNKYIKT
jgi:DEAD/DEAH box helicase domain-containing protein